MKTLLIILAIYVALDIISGVGIYVALRSKGWDKWELGGKFRDIMRLSYEDFKEKYLR